MGAARRVERKRACLNSAAHFGWTRRLGIPQIENTRWNDLHFAVIAEFRTSVGARNYKFKLKRCASIKDNKLTEGNCNGHAALRSPRR